MPHPLNADARRAATANSIDRLLKEDYGKPFRDILIACLREALHEDDAPARCRRRLCRRRNRCFLDAGFDHDTTGMPVCHVAVSPATEARAVRTARLILELWNDELLSVEME